MVSGYSWGSQPVHVHIAPSQRDVPEVEACILVHRSTVREEVRVQALGVGFGFEGSGFRVYSSRVWGLRFGVQG